jgi:hypothetical protein
MATTSREGKGEAVDKLLNERKAKSHIREGEEGDEGSEKKKMLSPTGNRTPLAAVREPNHNH